jgi:hypothetical protein
MIEQKVDKYKCFRQDSKGILWVGDRLVVSKNPELRKKILDEAHLSKFSMHPGSNKMYHDLRSLYWWIRMKREIARYVSECDTCQRVKASHLKVAGTLQPLPIPSWKWEDICMDFIVCLPNTSRHHDSIWVIVDRLTKIAHFLPVHTTHKTEKYTEIYIDQIVRLHGISKTIVSDRGALFVARFLGAAPKVTWHHCDQKLSVPSVGPVLRRRRSSRKKRPSAEAVCVRWPKVPLHEASVLLTDLKIE